MWQACPLSDVVLDLDLDLDLDCFTRGRRNVVVQAQDQVRVHGRVQVGANVDDRSAPMKPLPDDRGYFGAYGGRFVPETLMAPLDELEAAWREARRDRGFRSGARPPARHLRRPADAALVRRAASRSTSAARAIYLKREDLCHTGAHKINNALGQACSRSAWASRA